MAGITAFLITTFGWFHRFFDFHLGLDSPAFLIATV